jgi:hypothetical protein
MTSFDQRRDVMEAVFENEEFAFDEIGSAGIDLENDADDVRDADFGKPPLPEEFYEAVTKFVAEIMKKVKFKFMFKFEF